MVRLTRKAWRWHGSIRDGFTLLAILLALPWGWGCLTGMWLWLSPFVFLHSWFVLQSLVWLNGLAAVILALSLWRKRWFCRNACPVGSLCDGVSKCSRVKTASAARVPSIGSWLAILSLASALMGVPLFIWLDPMAIFHGFFSMFSDRPSLPLFLSMAGLPLLLLIHLWLPGIWCKKVCPLGGLQELLFGFRTLLIKSNSHPATSSVPSSGRRIFVAATTGLAAGFLLNRFVKPENNVLIRPPASVHSPRFDLLCVRCGNCIKACPTEILSHQVTLSGKFDWMVPEVRFDRGYCLETCNLCGTVCPSGAIFPFSVEAKRSIRMGTAKVHLSRCLLSRNGECDRCKMACSYQALAIRPVSGLLLMAPVVEGTTCVGCGACAVICPTDAIEMLPLNV